MTAEPTPKRLQTQRYLLLIDQLKKEHVGSTGSVNWVASQLGVHQSYLSKLAGDPTRDVGGRTLAAAIKRLRIDPDFFYDPTLKQPHYRDYVGGKQRRVELDGPDQAALNDFLAAGSMAPVTDEERALLEKWADGSFRKGGIKPLDYAEHLATIRLARKGFPKPVFEGEDRANQNAAEQVKKKGGMRPRGLRSSKKMR